MKKTISAIILGVALVLPFANPVSAATEGSVSNTETEYITGQITAEDSAVTVVVNLAEGSGLTNGKVTVSYDTAAFTLESATLGTAAAASTISDLNTEKAADVGTVSAAWAETTADTEGGELLTVVLTAVNDDELDSTVTVTLSDAGTEGTEVAVEEDSFDLNYVDKTALEELTESLTEKEENAELSESDYTEESWSAYKEALAAAETVLANDDATQAEVNAALAALEDAYNALTPVETDTETEIGSEKESESETEFERETESGSETESESETESGSETESESETESDSEKESDSNGTSTTDSGSNSGSGEAGGNKTTGDVAAVWCITLLAIMAAGLAIVQSKKKLL